MSASWIIFAIVDGLEVPMSRRPPYLILFFSAHLAVIFFEFLTSRRSPYLILFFPAYLAPTFSEFLKS